MGVKVICEIYKFAVLGVIFLIQNASMDSKHACRIAKNDSKWWSFSVMNNLRPVIGYANNKTNTTKSNKDIEKHTHDLLQLPSNEENCLALRSL